ncbi:MAG: hypothetical protein Kow002_19960 [Anaerolineales bacterium]
MKRLALLLTLFLTACNLPWLTQSAPPAESAAKVTATPAEGFAFDLPNERKTPASEPCYFNWARQPLPRLSNDLERALKDHIQPQASGRAEAYGENCITEDGQVLRFLAMETDFHVTLKVKDLEDRATLGKLVEQVMAVLESFPADETPGPQTGYVGITFEAKGNELQLWFMIAEAQSLLENGLRGKALFDALGK